MSIKKHYFLFFKIKVIVPVDTTGASVQAFKSIISYYIK